MQNSLVFMMLIAFFGLAACDKNLKKEEAQTMLNNNIEKLLPGEIFMCSVEFRNKCSSFSYPTTGTVTFCEPEFRYPDECEIPLKNMSVIASVEATQKVNNKYKSVKFGDNFFGKYYDKEKDFASIDGKFVCGKISAVVDSVTTEERNATVKYNAKIELNESANKYKSSKCFELPSNLQIERKFSLKKDDDGHWHINLVNRARRQERRASRRNRVRRVLAPALTVNAQGRALILTAQSAPLPGFLESRMSAHDERSPVSAHVAGGSSRSTRNH